MRAINAAYRMLSDPAQRAVHDARRYVPRTGAVHVSAPPRVRRVVVVSTANPPTRLQRRVDRIVAIVGILLLIGIAFYTVNVIPYAGQQLSSTQRSGIPGRR